MLKQCHLLQANTKQVINTLHALHAKLHCTQACQGTYLNSWKKSFGGSVLISHEWKRSKSSIKVMNWSLCHYPEYIDHQINVTVFAQHSGCSYTVSVFCGALPMCRTTLPLGDSIIINNMRISIFVYFLERNMMYKNSNPTNLTQPERKTNR